MVKVKCDIVSLAERSITMLENMEKNLENETEEIKKEEKRYPSRQERKRLKEEEKKRKKEEERKLLTDIAVAQAELNALKQEYGLEEEEKGIKKAITGYFNYRENREKVRVKKKTYIWLSVLLGWLGAHRFYSKQYVIGILYILTLWLGVPIAMTVIDLMVIIPMKPDEEGYVLI